MDRVRHKQPGPRRGPGVSLDEPEKRPGGTVVEELRRIDMLLSQWRRRKNSDQVVRRLVNRGMLSTIVRLSKASVEALEVTDDAMTAYEIQQDDQVGRKLVTQLVMAVSGGERLTHAQSKILDDVAAGGEIDLAQVTIIGLLAENAQEVIRQSLQNIARHKAMVAGGECDESFEDFDFDLPPIWETEGNGK